ncbi:MAG TPA: PEGA domain-containing protein [Kofleriaceae bacterium]|nr:PEGA domain-containing protein [Kofleriaceae bacterium]
MRLKIAILAAVAIGFVAAPAFADSGVGAVVVTGKVADRDLQVATKAASASLTAAGWVLAEKPFSTKESTALNACFAAREVASCVKGVLAEKQKVSRLAAIGLERQQGPEGVITLAVTARIVVPGNTVETVSAQRFCDHCTDDTLTSAVTDVTKELLDKVSLANGRTVLSVTASPSGAFVYVDGHSVGAASPTLAVSITPGRHRIRVEHDACVAVEQTIEGTEGKTATLDVSLKLTAEVGTAPVKSTPVVSSTVPVARPPQAARSSKLLPYTLIISGGVAVVGAGVLFAMNEPDGDGAPAGQEQPRTYQSTILPASGLLLGGAVAIGLGSYLLWHGSNKQPATVMLAPTSGGGVVGFAKSF